MKLMKMIYIYNMMIQEFQNFVEFQLIEVMNLKMLLIQVDSIPRIIQTIMIELLCTLQNILL
jgi:hypothetical protein